MQILRPADLTASRRPAAAGQTGARRPAPRFLALASLTAFFLLFGPTALTVSADEAAAGHGPRNPHTSASALQELQAGNERFATGRSVHPRQEKPRLSRLAAEGQTPLAAVLACSDSRAPVEAVFDQGFGDLFVVRAAGAVPGVDQLGSLEYAAAHLGVPLIVVLSHTKCGAVTAAVTGAQEPGALGELLTKLSPAAAAVRNDGDAAAQIEKAVIVSAALFARRLTEASPALAEAVEAGRLQIKAAVYDLDAGRVTFAAE
ncbi:MAG: carbonic anhydrase [Deltaproteobacteria bacterium]|jgi:carbonic anhydrase|nr:carbonic anhydrase [Deltaproteobacteria bacterium]